MNSGDYDHGDFDHVRYDVNVSFKINPTYNQMYFCNINS